MSNQISDMDKMHYEMIRKNVSLFLKNASEVFDSKNVLILDIAPQVHEGAKAHFIKGTIETLDIDSASGATYVADLCLDNSSIISSEKFDIVVCTEVLEHTVNPFSAIDEVYRILKSGGILLLTVPFNFRIHGPLPDCWRFTEHGLKQLLKKFKEVQITELPAENRWLMPVQYTVIARK